MEVLVSTIRGAAAIGFVFGLVVFIHELGHFLAAKLFGVYAPRFSIGFGPALWSRKWGETEYVVAAVPLGGYVRMASRDDETMAFIEGGNEQPAEGAPAKRPRHWTEDGMAPFGPHPVPPDRWYESKSFVARLIIMLAGVSMNILLGFAVYTGISAVTGRTVIATRVVGTVKEIPSQPQFAAGLATGDTVVAVNGKPVATWDDIDNAIDSVPGDSVVLRTQRGSIAIAVGPAESKSRRDLMLSFGPLVPPVIEDVATGRPAQRAGLMMNDSIVAIDGAPVNAWRQVVERIEASPGRPLTVDVMRQGKPVSLSIRPDSTEETDPDTKAKSIVGRIGAAPRLPTGHMAISLGQAVKDGATLTYRAAGSVVVLLRRLVTGGASVRQLGGPVAIGGAAVAAAKRGWEELLGLLAFLSVNVAVLNLLPIPILDGGQVLLLAAEKVKGGALSLRTREYLMRFGLAMILLLVVVVMFNDITAQVRSFLKP
jgi:regulator of sigma E protease